MKLNDEQNRAFMSDPRRIAAQKELDSITQHISHDLKSDGGAMYYLSVLPPLLCQLETAYENLSTVEATITAELLNQNRFHG